MSKLMNSGYARIEDDDYKTVDPRPTLALLKNFEPDGLCVDVCSPTGSGIVDVLRTCGYMAQGVPDAFADELECEFIISNPPYKRPLVDDIIVRQIDRIRSYQVLGVAMLLRWGFDYAASRAPMFADNSNYYGQVKMLFRPLWKQKRPGDKNPFHPFNWHIWMAGEFKIKRVMYANVSDEDLKSYAALGGDLSIFGGEEARDV